MKVTFLGTGTSQGVPVIACTCAVCRSTNPKDKRLRSSVMMEENGHVFVVDSGPDFRQQMLREDVRRLDAILYTHEHKDHTAGMDDVRAFNYVSDEPANLYATKRVQEALKKEFAYVFSGEDYPGIPKIKFHTISNEVFNVKGTTFTPIEVFHMNLPVLGFRTGKFTYITDANRIPEKAMKQMEGSDVIVLNALRREKHISHFNLEEAVEMLEKLSPKKAYLIHISHQLGLHDEINNELPSFIRCAYDGLSIEI